ncbi:MAG: HD domain-containing protein [Bacteroidales bacterium]|nr:HD domain-containing protein [Bacteroidales bacterium]MBN2821510.1 HD domain-containing protein [Bacteroidales bacterium]
MLLTVKDLIAAFKFSADKHRKQRRKGEKDVPYINHPAAVANLLAFTGGESDMVLLIASLLHDTIEDTNTTPIEIEERFGTEVLNVVLDVTDDMSLSKSVRKALQVEKAEELSARAKMIKIADKTCNILDMLETRFTWTRKQKIEYVNWSKAVVEHCRGINEQLDKEFDKAVKIAESVLIS